MSGSDSNWLKHPTKKQMIITIAVWIVGLALSISSATDFYTKSIFVSRNIFTLFLCVFATIVMLKVVRNYKNGGTISN